MRKKYNIILITVDSLRADHLSCFGYSQKTTPHLDSLAEEGVLFTQAFSNGGGSVESFPAIITSTFVLMNPHSNLEDNAFWALLSEKWQTISELLKKNDYSTAAFVNKKIDISSRFGYHRGFETFKNWEDDGANRSKGELVQKINTLRGNKFVRAETINQEAIEWIKKHKRHPFFLWLHYMDTHPPPNPKKMSFLKRVKAIRLVRKALMNTSKLRSTEVKQVIELYDQEIKYVDEQVHLLVNQLADLGINFENTYFIILSDHGEQFFEHGEMGHGRLYDHVLHVPLILIGPELPRKTKISKLVSLIDVAPTISDLCGLAKPMTFLGKSLLPIIYEDAPSEDFVISETLLYDYSYRTLEWKYILHLKTQTHELYDLKEDPYEKSNIVNLHPDKVKIFKKLLKKQIVREQRLKLKLDKERAVLLNEKQQSLSNYPKRNETFIKRVLGVPIVLK